MGQKSSEPRLGAALSVTVRCDAQPLPMRGPGYSTPGAAEVRHIPSSLYEPAWDDPILGVSAGCDFESMELPRHLVLTSDDMPRPRLFADSVEDEKEEGDLVDEDEDELEDDEEEDEEEIFPDDPEEDEHGPEQDDTDDDDLPDDDDDS